jgi:hypothetical protein
MRSILRGLLAFGLIPASIACSDDRTASGWIPVCHRLPAEEAEHIISVNGERLDDPYPDEVVQDALRRELTEFPF